MQQLRNAQATLETRRDRKQRTIAMTLGKQSFAEIDWRMLMREGMLIDLSIQRCRFTAQLDLSELGVTVQDDRVRQALSRTVTLGEKRLLPEAYMKSLCRIESGARRLLSKNSFHTELGYFIPVTAYEAWKQETQVFEQRYFTLRNEILDNYRNIVQQVIAEYEIIARDTYGRIRSVNPATLSESEEAFIVNYCNRIVSLIPEKERIKDSFAFEAKLIDGMKRMSEAMAEDAEQPEGGMQLSPSQIRGESEERTWQREQMRRDLLRQAQEQKKTIVDGFLSTVVAQLRVLVYDVMTDVLSSMQKRGDDKFPPRSLVQLKNLVAQIAQLNFYGDEDIARMTTQIQAILDQSPAARQRSITDVREKLRSIATVARSTLLDLDIEPRSAIGLAIPAVPTDSSVRQAREELGLDLDLTTFAQLSQPREERTFASLPLWDESVFVAGRESRLA